MGCIMSIMSNIMYFSEKITLYVTCVSLVTCLVIMFVVTLTMGIGLGYNYCFVDLKTKVKYVPAHYQYKGSPRWPYLREGDPGSLYAKNVDDAEDDSLGTRLTPPPEEDILSDPSVVRLDKNMTHPLIYNISEPIDIDEDDFTVASSNTTYNADNTSDQMKETKTKKPTDDSELKVSSSEEWSSVHEPDMINKLGEPFPEASTNSSDADNRRVKKLVIPISGLDLISLLSKLRAENKNYSLQIVTN